MRLTDLIGRALPFFDIHVGTPGSPERIRDLAQRLKIAFPSDYALVLSTYGSLYVKPKYTTPGDDPICVYGFAGSGKTQVLDIEKAAVDNDLFTQGLWVDNSCAGEIEPPFADSRTDVEITDTQALRQAEGLVPILSLDEGHLSRGPKEMDKAWVLTRKGSLLDIYKMRLDNPRSPFIVKFGELIQGSVERALDTEGVDENIIAALSVFSNELKDWLD
jgi:hypothetical protein